MIISRLWLTLFWLLLFSSASVVIAQDFKFGGSLRGYQFVTPEGSPFMDRRDSELWLLRLTPEASWGDVSFEVHGLLSFVSPPLFDSSRIVVSDSRTFFSLDHDFTDSSRVDLLGSFDRLNMQVELKDVKITLGRQAVSWGVSFFWPALDLFAPFSPRQIDREYKAGVDAVRFTIPLGSFSEVELIGGSLGSSLNRSGAVGALIRLNAGSADVGFMGGRFHRDTVAGAFVTADLRGTGLRGEVAWTESGAAEDALLDRQRFWRGSFGLMRQVMPSVSLTVEMAWNGFGTGEASEYQAFLEADRLLRGEVNALARAYTGVSTSWLLHPLFTFNQTLLLNWDDHSSLSISTLSWSAGNNSEVLVGAQLGLGDGLAKDEVPRSEYGLVPSTIFAALRYYF